MSGAPCVARYADSRTCGVTSTGRSREAYASVNARRGRVENCAGRNALSVPSCLDSTPRSWKAASASTACQTTAAAADAATTRQLQALQLQADTADWRLLPARVIATGPGAGFQWSVTLDVGHRENVLVGQTVTDGLGLVGRVVAVYSTTSVVLLAADPTSGVGVRDVRSGALLLATGAGSGPLRATALEERVDIRVGDRLVTGPAGKTTYAPGVAVGVVTSVTTAADGTVSARVRPTTAQFGLDLVGIILQTPRGTARPALEPASGSNR